MRLKDQQKTLISFVIIVTLLIVIAFVLTESGNKYDRSQKSLKFLTTEYKQLATEFRNKTGETPTTVSIPDNADEPIVIEGIDGEDGRDGIDGRPGVDGINGTNGIDGKDGVDGRNGVDGKDGIDGKNLVTTVTPPKEELTPFILELINFYLTENPPPAGPPGATGATGSEGPMGPQGEPGVDGRTPTSEELMTLISNYISSVVFSCEQGKGAKILTCKVG